MQKFTCICSYLISLTFLHDLSSQVALIFLKKFKVDENMRIKVCDFGFARDTSQSHEQKFMTRMGTDHWVHQISVCLCVCVQIDFVYVLSY
jgi:hypothetical protein